MLLMHSMGKLSILLLDISIIVAKEMEKEPVPSKVIAIVQDIAKSQELGQLYTKAQHRTRKMRKINKHSRI